MNMTNDEIRKANLAILIGEVGKKSDLAKMADTDPAYISQVLSTKKPRNIGDDFARKLEAACGKPRGWMDAPHNQDQSAIKIDANAELVGGFEEWDESTPLHPDDVALPLFRGVELSAGSGAFHVDENHGNKLRFARSTLRKRNVAAANAACVRVAGDSMEPVIPDGTTVGIDTANKTIVDGKIYAIDHFGHLRIKRLYRLVDGTVRINSYNPDYKDEEISGDSENFRVIGRLFWYAVLPD